MEIVKNIRANPIAWLCGAIIGVVGFFGSVWAMFLGSKTLPEIWSEGGWGGVTLQATASLIVFLFITTLLTQIPWAKKFRRHPQATTPMTFCIVGVIGAFLAIGIWALLAPTAESAGKPKATSAPSVRLKYSSRQTINCEPEGPTQVINLDNEAMMTMWSCSTDAVEFLVSKTGPITTKKPKLGEKYKTGEGLTMEFPPVPGMSVWNAITVSGPAKKYQFTVDKRVQVIPVGKRKFRVSLDQINDDSENDVQKISYVFAISEE
jgi:hypothetical protein